MSGSDDDAAGDLEVTRRLVLPAGALTWRFSRASGPGGQGVNTTDSRVELVVDLAACPGIPDDDRARLLERLRLVDGHVVSVTAAEHRSQRRNREAARRRLAALLRDALAPDPPPRRPRRPSRGARQRRLDDKKRRGAAKALRRAPSD